MMTNEWHPLKNEYVGVEIDGYTLESEIRRELLGVVYRAYNKTENIYVLCKLIPKDLLKNDCNSKIKINARKLEGISQILYYNDPIEIKLENKSIICVFSQYLEGKSLLEYVSGNNKNITIPFIKLFADQMLQLFVAIEKIGINSHGFLNGNNILILHDPFTINPDIPTLKVTDFDFKLGHLDNLVLKDDYSQFALICQSLLEVIDYSILDGKDRYFYDVFIEDFLTKKVLETDPTVEGDYVRKPLKLLSLLYHIPEKYKEKNISTMQKLTDPFDYLRCEDIGDSFELLQLLYSKNFPIYSSLLSKNNTVLTGPRGCGKTTIFRNISLKTQILGNKVKKLDDFSDDYIGIYYHCNDLYFAFPYLNGYIADDERRGIIHYFNLSIFSEILDLLNVAKDIEGFELDQNTIYTLQKLFSKYVSSYTVPPCGTNVIEHLIAFVLGEKVILRQWFGDNKNNQPDLLPMDFLKNVCKLLQNEIHWMKGRVIYFFLDDYSSPSISIDLQETLHDFIFFPSAGSEYFFKVSTESFISFHPYNSKKKLLEEGREYLTVDFGDIFLGNEEAGKDFLYEVVNNRLKNSEIHEKYHNIEQILGDSPLKIYVHMAEQIREGKHEIYSGHQVIMGLCSGDVAQILSLIKRIFESNGGLKAFMTPDVKLPIDAAKQNKVVKEMGNEFLDKIEMVPDIGQDLREVTEAFGNVAHWYLVHKDSKNQTKSPPWQAYRIEMRERPTLDEKSQKIYDGLLRYSIFIKDSRGKSQRGVVAPRLYLRKLLIPTFRLSPSKRDNIGLDTEELNLLLNNPSEFESYMESDRCKKGIGSNKLSKYL
ncbi:ORC-CDC6 family AAA ATPase [Methanogenium organophilum]|uniref:Protein kinase domain-containing protein n=1 Tax=Methanogenium organophilum TaxID=2199 RepID=A0A9X9T9B2_METOG|nr:hypothetical protein [Methanogenium organophilum]WAI02231.1 hypothetical protein OU421_05000 [Methanogenium organophilum]